MESPKTARETDSKQILIALALVNLLVVICYLPTQFDYFLSDDFHQLVWLKNAMADPVLILQNFYNSCLNTTTTSFYRPMIPVTMAVDYLLWKSNGLGFHITNLTFHLIATTTIYFIAKGLLEDAKGEGGEQPDAVSLYGLAASLIYGLYPLHPEAVVWMIGRVDTVTTAFICLAFLFYRKYRKAKKLESLTAAVIFTVLGLMSKEMAICLPFIFFAYSFFLGDQEGFRSKLINSIIAVLPFGLILALYFGVRYISLGTFVGGYDDSLFVSDFKHYILTWVHGLRMFFIPLNREIVSSSNPLTYLWLASLCATGALIIYNLVKSEAVRKLTLFNLSFLFFAFLPVYKLFAIGNDLQGARLAHVASVVVSIILGSAIIKTEKGKMTLVKRLVTASYVVLCFAGLWVNNSVWAEAGRTSNAIKSSLTEIYKNIEGDPQVVLLNLPDNYKGAYIARNALEGMTKTPQFFRDINNCLMINPHEVIVPIGYLKESIREEAKDKVRIFSWVDEKKQFKEIFIDQKMDPYYDSWFSTRLKELMPGAFIQRDVALIDESTPEVKLAIPEKPCYDFELVRIYVESVKATSANPRAVLYYTNSLYPQFDGIKSIVRKLNPRVELDVITFPLSSRPDWYFGGTSKNLKLKFLDVDQVKITKVDIDLKQNHMPRLSFENSGFLGSKGYLHLTSSQKDALLFVDGSNVKYAFSTLVTITKANQTFRELNADYPEPVVLHRIKAGLTERIKLKRKMFPSDGLYEVRAWCISKTGQILGVASDHIVVSVDS